MTNVDRAESIYQATVDDINKEAQEQGLTPDMIIAHLLIRILADLRLLREDLQG